MAPGNPNTYPGDDVWKDVSARSPLTAGLLPSEMSDEAPSRLGQSRRRRKLVGPEKRSQIMQQYTFRNILCPVTIRRRRIGVLLDLAAPHSFGQSNKRMQRKPCASLICNFIRSILVVFYVSRKTCRKDSLLMRSLLIILALLGQLFKVCLLLGVVLPVIFCTSILRLFVICGGCFRDAYQAAYSSSLESPSPAEDVTRMGVSVYIRDHGSELTSPRTQPSGKDRSYSNCC